MQNNTKIPFEHGDLVSYWTDQLEHDMAQSHDVDEVDVVHEGLWKSVLEMYRQYDVN